MPDLAVAIAVFVGAACAYAGARVLASYCGRSSRALDDTWDGLRRAHVAPTCRIGGIAVLVGVIAGAAVHWAVSGTPGRWLLLFVCAAPAFGWGLIEDLSKRGAVLPRLALPAVAAALGFVLVDARITHLSVPVLDSLLAVHAASFLFTVFAVTGVTHAINVVDGLNGLAGMSALFASIGLAVVAWIAGDPLVFSAACILAAGIAGFVPANFPSGRIFLGDGGAYLVGFLLAELSVILVHRNTEVSPWFPLVLLAYPIWETLFSMARRRMRGRSSTAADALHLHTLVFRRVVRWRGFSGRPADQVARNSLASLCLWILPALCLAAALAFWNNSLALQASAGGFVILYAALYYPLVRFRVPSWLVIRARKSAAAAGKMSAPATPEAHR